MTTQRYDMIINTTIILTALSLSAATSSAFAESDDYISWTFDDFDSNCEVYDSRTTQADKTTPSTTSDNYITWTFDDFDNNCDVMD